MKRVDIHSQIEPLEARIAPTIVAVNGGGNTPNFVDDNSGPTANTLELRMQAGTGLLEYQVNNGGFSTDLDTVAPGIQSAPASSLVSISVNLGSDNDTLIINNSNGPVNLNSINFDGGAGTNVLSISGTSNADTFNLAGNSVLFNATSVTGTNVTSMTLTGGGTDTVNVNGTVNLSGALALTAGTVTIGASTSAAGVTITADTLAVNAALTSTGTNRLTIKPLTAARQINLGTEVAGALSLTSTEIGFLSAGVLEIGSTSAGFMTLSASISYAPTTLALITGLSIIDGLAGDTSALITVQNLRLETASGIGISGAIEINVTNLAFSNRKDVGTTGGVQITDLDGLTLTPVDGLTLLGNIAPAPDSTHISTKAGALTLTGGSILCYGDVYLDAADLPSAGQNVVIQGGVFSLNGKISITAGDNMTVQNGSISAETTVLFWVDYLNQDPGVGATFTGIPQIDGSELSVIGENDNDTFFFSPTSRVPPKVTVSSNGGNDTLFMNDQNDGTADVVTFTPTSQTSGIISINPGIPAFDGSQVYEYSGMSTINYTTGAGGDVYRITPNFGTGATRFNLNGNTASAGTRDSLEIDASAATFTPRVAITGTGSGTWSLAGFSPINWTGIELLDAPADYEMHLATMVGGGNGTPDTVQIAETDISGQRELQVFLFPALLFNAVDGTVLSLAINGSSDDETLRVVEAGAGLPHFSHNAVGAFINTAFLSSEGSPGVAGLYFEGFGGTNSIELQLTTSHSVSFLPDDILNFSNVLSVANEFAISVGGSDQNVLVKGNGGTFTFDASGRLSVEQVQIGDNDLSFDGFNRISGAFEFPQIEFGGFSQAVVRSGAGSETLRILASIDKNAPAFTGPALASLILDGGDIFGRDSSGDTFVIENLPATMTATLIGGSGDDIFSINSLAGGGTVRLDGGVGSDILSFAGAAGPVSIDLEDISTAQSILGGNLVLVDVVENLTGSPFADTVHVRRQLATTLSMDLDRPGGVDGVDTLIIDAGGQFATIERTGPGAGQVRFPDFATITFAGTEIVRVENSTSSGGFSGTGPGAFGAPTSYDTPKGAVAVAVGDINNDGIADLVTANGKAGNASIFFGLGNGLYAPFVPLITGGKRPIDVVLKDFDGDNVLDLFVLHSVSSNIAFLKGNGDGTFAEPQLFATASKPVAFAMGNLNADSHADLVAVTASGKLSILLAKSDGTGFDPAVSQSSGGIGAVDVAIADFNGDGAFDLAVLHAKSKRLTVNLGDNTGTFTNPSNSMPISKNATALAVADFNNDGRLDIAVNYALNRFVGVLLNDGMFFTPQLRIGTGGTKTARFFAQADFNGDGNVDLALGTADGAALRVLLGTGTGLFAAARDFDLGSGPLRTPSAIAVGDLNGDGAVDVALAHPKSGELTVLLRSVV
jgi:FG-GAP-like repeat